MKYIFLLFTICVNTAVTYSQSGKLTGVVSDSSNNLPLELATISVFNNDSSLIGYKLSNNAGKYLFDKLPLQKNLIINVTYAGYTSYSAVVRLKGIDTLNVLLSLNTNDSNAVVVKAVIPVRMNGDTLEINPAAFKMKPDAVVEELLNQVPGITIWSDGTITVDGRKVENFFVDGKPFLGSNDPRLATQNLPKSAIDKIQLYQEYDRSRIGQQAQPEDSLLTMNIKLKENSKTGYFGKGGAGYGTTGRYEADLAIQAYNKKSSIGIGGGLNNINKNINNLQELFQNNTYRNINPNLYNVGRFGASGINKNHSIGAMYNHNFNEDANSRRNNRILVSYNISGTDAYIKGLNLENRTALANPQFIRGESEQNSRNNNHAIIFNYVKNRGYSDNLGLNGNIGFNNNSNNSNQYTEVTDASGQIQSINNQTTQQKGSSDNESLNTNFSRNDEENPLKSFTIQFNTSRGSNTSERNTHTDFQSFTNSSADTSYNRRYINNGNSFTIGGNINYTGFKRLLLGRFDLFGIDINLVQWFNYVHSSDDAEVSDYDNGIGKFISNNKLSNHNKRDLFEYTPSLSLTKSFSKWMGMASRSFNMGVRLYDDIKTEKNSSSIAYRNVSRSFQFFRQEASAGFSYNRQNKYRYFMNLNYASNTDFPSIDQLYSIVDDINAYYIRIGNPNLKNRVNKRLNFNANFNKENQQSLLTVNGAFNAGYNLTRNPVADSVINEPSGKRIIYYVNADNSRSMNMNYNFNIARRIKKSNIQLTYNGNYNNNRTPGYVDNIYTEGQARNSSNQFSLQFSLRDLLVLNIGKTFQQYKSKQTAAGLNSFTNKNKSTKLGFTLNYPKGFAFSSTFDHINNSNLSEPTNLWNAFATYRFMKQQAEVKLSAMDILKEYQNISNSASIYGTSTRITNGLEQYFMLTLSYYPRKFGKSEVRRPGRMRR